MSHEEHLGRDPFDRLVLDETFIRGGRHEPPARTREAISRFGGPDTSFRYSPPPGAVDRVLPLRHTSFELERVRVSGIFLWLVVMFAVTLTLCWETGSRFAVFAVVVTGWLISLCLHEFAHAAVAYAAGDRSAAVRDYLRLDLRRYAHPVLTFVLPVLYVFAGGIGLPGGAVQLDQTAFRSRRMCSLVSLAGPAANVVCAALCLGPLAIASRSQPTIVHHLPLWSALAFLGFLEITAVVINLLPVPGLDGWGALAPYLSHEAVAFGRKAAPFGAIILFFVVFRSAGMSRGLGSALVHVETLLGVSPGLAAVGDYLFRFWT